MYPLPIGRTDDPFDSGRILTILPDARRKHKGVFAGGADIDFDVPVPPSVDARDPKNSDE